MKIKASNKVLIPFFAGFFCLLAVLYFIFVLHDGSNTVIIRKNGEITEKIDLSAVSSPVEIELGGNTVLIESDGFSMVHADCPDKLCIKQGKITDGKGAVICMPNKVIVEFEHPSGDADAVSGAR